MFMGVINTAISHHFPNLISFYTSRAAICYGYCWRGLVGGLVGSKSKTKVRMVVHNFAHNNCCIASDNDVVQLQIGHAAEDNDDKHDEEEEEKEEENPLVAIWRRVYVLLASTGEPAAFQATKAIVGKGWRHRRFWDLLNYQLPWRQRRQWMMITVTRSQWKTTQMSNCRVAEAIKTISDWRKEGEMHTPLYNLGSENDLKQQGNTFPHIMSTGRQSIIRIWRGRCSEETSGTLALGKTDLLCRSKALRWQHSSKTSSISREEKQRRAQLKSQEHKRAILVW